MKLKVTLRHSGDGRVRTEGGGLTRRTQEDIQVTADATATVGDVAAAIAHSERLAGQFLADRPVTLRRLDPVGQQMPPLRAEQSLLESGIQSGSTLELTYAEESDGSQGPTAAVLRVLAGPDRGQEFHLPLGTAQIGRTPDSEVRLSDPLVSKRHARLAIGTRVEVIDQGSANGVVVGGVQVPRVTLAVGDVVEIGDSKLSLISLASNQRAGSGPGSTDVAFVRAPRVVARPERAPVELPDAPTKPQRQSFPWLMLLGPLVLGAAIYWRLSSTSSGQAGFALLFVAMTPLLMLGNYMEQRRQRKRDHAESVAEFRSSLDACREELRLGQELELLQRLELHPSTDECVRSVDRMAGLLWSRRPEHPEFLTVRFGLGSIAPSTFPELPKARGLAEFYAEAAATADEYARLHGAPVVGNVRSVGGLGLAGDRAVAAPVANALAAQIAVLHSPAEVAIACLTSTAGRSRWEWLQWLPHTSSPHSPLPVHLAADPAAGQLLLSQLEELISVRSRSGVPDLRGPLEESRSDHGDTPIVPSVVVVVDDTGVDMARLTRVAEAGPDVGVFVLWVAESLSGIPAACRTFAEVTGEGRARVGMVRHETTVPDVACESLGAEQALALARRLAPVVDAGAPVEDSSDLPRSVSLVSLVGHEASDEAAVVAGRWRENLSLVPRDGSPPVSRDKDGTLRAVVGHAGSEDFTLDLRTQGPHALVGGTTGAGKSEFLQAWVLGMAHAYSPDRVTFLFVDYKGGAAFAKCVDLPHCVGLVTDLSPYLVRRALRSLRAELHHRERLLNAKGKKDLLELERSGDPECPPSLIIVVDEFAALVGEVPEFVDGVVDVAQRGRSLGLHLVLATQRPAGVIKDNLRANTNLRIALRMADESDSQDVLGDAMAAHFPSSIPGRGAAKTGPGRITPFQSAFPGARTPVVAEAPPIEVTDLDFGRIRPWKMPERSEPTAVAEKDIDRIVATVRGAAELAQVPAPRRPWLESLAPIYSLARLNPRRDTRIPLGVLDDPDHQTQTIDYFLPDEEGNILFVGAGGSGKSTALRSVAIASAITPGGGLTHVYGLDFAGGSLSSLEVLPNVSSVIVGEDHERVRRLIDFLAETIEERSTRYTSLAASTLHEYRQLSGHDREPRILVLLDGFASFRTALEGSTALHAYYQRFQRILLDGRAVGVHVAMSADRPTAIPSSVLSTFQRRIALRLSDDDAYLALGVPRDILDASSPPGRAIRVGTGHELQLAVFISAEHVAAGITSSAAQVSAMEKLARDIGRHHTRPEPIRSLPTTVSSRELPLHVDGKPVLGLLDATLQAGGFDPHGLIMVAGPAQSGRTNAVHWLAQSVRRCHPDTPLVHLSARRTPLSSLDLWSMTADNESDVRGILEDVEQLAAETSPETLPLLAVFIENIPDFISSSVENQLHKLLQTCRRNGHLVVAEGETPAWNSPWPLLMEVRNARTGLLLQPDQGDGDTLLRTSLPRVKRSDLPVGRGFWVKGGVAGVVQLPLAEGWGEQPMDEIEWGLESSAHELAEAGAGSQEEQ